MPVLRGVLDAGMWGATCPKCWAFSYGRGCSALGTKLLPSPREAGSMCDLLVPRGQREGPWDVGAPPVSSVVGPEVQLLRRSDGRRR